MARADTTTLLALDEFAKIMGLHPLHFNGIFLNDVAPATTCGQPIVQHSWQAVNAMSREDVAIAIADVEARIAQYTRFKLLPTFENDERHTWPQPYMPELFAPTLFGARGQLGSVQTSWGELIAAGVQGATPLALSAGVAYTDTDGDGYAETATITAPAGVVADANEIALFYPGTTADPAWEIRPIRVQFVGTNVVITARREQLVNPGLTESMIDGSRGIDGSDATKFSTTVDVYRVFHDPSQQVQFLWEGSPASCGCGDTGCQVCYLQGQFGCAVVRDGRSGLVAPQAASWNSATQAYETASLAVFRAPDRIRLWYRAGWRDNSRPRPMREMDQRWARAVAYFAASMLERPLCACQNVNAQIEHWQTDVAKLVVNPGGTSENFQNARSLLENPFGTTRGAVYAWRVFKNEAIGAGL